MGSIEFISSFLSVISSWLLSDPICDFLGLFFAGCALTLIQSLIHRR